MLFTALFAPVFVLAQGLGQGTNFHVSPLGRSAKKFGHGTPAELIQGQCGITNLKSTPVTVTMQNGKLPITFFKEKAANDYIVDVRLQISVQNPAGFPNFSKPPVIRAVALRPGVSKGDVSLDIRQFMADKTHAYTWVQIVAYDNKSGSPIEKHCYPVYLKK